MFFQNVKPSLFLFRIFHITLLSCLLPTHRTRNHVYFAPNCHLLWLEMLFNASLSWCLWRDQRSCSCNHLRSPIVSMSWFVKVIYWGSNCGMYSKGDSSLVSILFSPFSYNQKSKSNYISNCRVKTTCNHISTLFNFHFEYSEGCTVKPQYRSQWNNYIRWK